MADDTSALLEIARKSLGKTQSRKKWKDAIQRLAGHGEAVREALLPILVRGLELVEPPAPTSNIVAFTRPIVAHALLTLAPDEAARILEPFLGELLFARDDAATTLLARLVELGELARPAMPALLRWANVRELPHLTSERSAAREAVARLGGDVGAPHESLDPLLRAAIESLGGTLGPRAPAGEVTPSIARLGEVVWPAGTTYGNKQSKWARHIWVWRMSWLGLTIDRESYPIGWTTSRTATIAHADGGNHAIHVVLDEKPFDPWVFRTDHEGSPHANIANGMPMVEWLRTLKPEKPAKKAP